MIKSKNLEKKAPLDYKEPYEFRLLIGDNIICQRYFKISNFNPLSLGSKELVDTIRYCRDLINEDLKSKTRVYTWHMTPLVFKNETEMNDWFANPNNASKVRICESIVLQNEEKSEYIWDGEKLVKCEKKVDDGVFTQGLTERDFLTYEFAFYVNDKKISSAIFEGVYPYYIRRNVDLSNTRGRFEGEDITRLYFDSYILHKLVHDRPDLVKKIVKELCYVCSLTDDNSYTIEETFRKPNGKNVSYPLHINTPKYIKAKYAKEIAKANRYLYGNSQR